MAEINTCEQYVLWKLEEAEEKVAALEEKIAVAEDKVKKSEAVIMILQDLFEASLEDDGTVKFILRDGDITSGKDPMAVQKINMLLELFGRKKEEEEAEKK